IEAEELPEVPAPPAMQFGEIQQPQVESAFHQVAALEVGAIAHPGTEVAEVCVVPSPGEVRAEVGPVGRAFALLHAGGEGEEQTFGYVLRGAEPVEIPFLVILADAQAGAHEKEGTGTKDAVGIKGPGRPGAIACLGIACGEHEVAVAAPGFLAIA